LVPQSAKTNKENGEPRKRCALPQESFGAWNPKDSAWQQLAIHGQQLIGAGMAVVGQQKRFTKQTGIHGDASGPSCTLPCLPEGQGF